MQKQLKQLTVLTTIILVGCGSNGSSTSASTTSNNAVAYLQSAPGRAAWRSFQLSSQNVTLNNPVNSTYQMMSMPDAGTSSFNGESGMLSVVQTVTISFNGVVEKTDSSRIYLSDDASFTVIGQVWGDGSYMVMDNTSPMPETLSVGQSGSLGSFTVYADKTKALVTANGSLTYDVYTYSDTQLKMCILTAETTVADNASGSETECYLISQSGVATYFSTAIKNSSNDITWQ